MRKRSLPFLLLLFLFSASLNLSAALTVTKVPDLSGSNEAPAIAVNKLGDLMVVYRNSYAGMAYYYKAHDGSSFVGPAAIPGQDYSAYLKTMIFYTDMAVTKDGRFHAIWSFDIHKVDAGLYYASFDPSTKSWTTPQKIGAGKVERPILTANTFNDDLLLAYDEYTGGINKDVFLKVMKSGTWRPAINISNPPEGFKPNHVTVLNRTDEAEGRPFQLSDKKAVMAPHGDLSETDAYVTVDDMTGYVYLTYKEDHREVVTDDWELRVVVALLDPSTYDILWTEQVTSGYLGFHFLPTVSAFNDKAMMAFAWYQEGTYNYIAFERKGNTLVYDSHVLEDHPIAAIPVAPHWEFFSRWLSYGDEFLFTYKTQGLGINLLRYKNGQWIDRNPVDLLGGDRAGWPYDSFLDTKRGLWTAWVNREASSSILFSLYDYTRNILLPAVDVKVETIADRAFLTKSYLNIVTWANNPFNERLGLPVSLYRVYRKRKGSSAYARVAEVNASTKEYRDENVTAGDYLDWDYVISCVDERGNESPLN
ncbi:MAG TPA: hypothetical protein PKK98_01655 [Candidatus Aminicenantes bacterium]|nr:hypothetical protein [Candidatus Aminicenantes bacterium]